MIRKALAAVSLLLVGLCLGWAFQSIGLDRHANAQAQREALTKGGQQPTNAPYTPTPQSGVQPVPPLNLPGLGAAPGTHSMQPNPFQQSVPASGGMLPGIQFPDGFIAMTTEEAINVAVYEKTNRSVVNISTNSIRPESLFVVTEVEGSGSGSVIDQQGHILTNFHVIEGAKQISVMLYNTDSFPAEVVGQDPDNDIAILKIQAPDTLLFPVPWGDSSNLRVGQHIIAIGNPFGYERTMSTGIISSLNRQIQPNKQKRPVRSLIQIDAALNQGNSGGPLLNSRGELIGMNMAIATRSGDSAGVGFAIPINTIRRVVPQLIATGRVQRPTIGIMQVFETDRGLLVVVLTPNGPAEKAGIKGSRMERKKVRRGVLVFEHDAIDHSQSDLIVGIDGQKVKQSDDLLSVIETKKSGDQVVLSIVRGGQILQVPVILGSSE